MKNILKLTLPSDRQVRVTRMFDAPRQLVWDAMTRAELLRQWFSGPPGWTLDVCEIDARVGGKYRYVWKGPGGMVMGMGGVIQEVDPPQRMVGTEAFDQPWYPGNNAVGTFEFQEKGDRTEFTLTVTYESKQARDIALSTPMEQGMAASYNSLESFLAAR